MATTTHTTTIKTLRDKLAAMHDAIKKADPETHRARLEKAREAHTAWSQSIGEPWRPNAERDRRLADLQRLQEAHDRADSIVSNLRPDIRDLERLVGAPKELEAARAKHAQAVTEMKDAEANATAAPQAVAHVAAMLAAAQAEHAKAKAAAASGLLAQVRAGGKPDVPTVDRAGLDVLTETHGAAQAEQKRCDEALAQARENLRDSRHELTVAELHAAELDLTLAIPAILPQLSRVCALHSQVRYADFDIAGLLRQRMREAEAAGSEA